MSLLSTLRRSAAVATIVTGIALFVMALQGVARVDTALDLAAARSAPDAALVRETPEGGPAFAGCRERDRDREVPA